METQFALNSNANGQQGMHGRSHVARHADARHCWLRLWLENNHLCLEVRDDGRGLPADVRSGVGLHAMQERAAELGGVCTIESGPGGTVVLAHLPL